MRALLLATLALGGCASTLTPVQHDMAAFRRGPYNFDFYDRHEAAFSAGAAFHFGHSKQHDVLMLTPMAEADHWDRYFDAEMTAWFHDPPRIEPHMADWSPHTAQAFWPVFRTIDWTHIHHEQTYDIMSSREIPWEDKDEVTARAVRYYLDKDRLARSPAPLDVTMRRAAVMMKPYFGAFRNNYPRSATFFYVAHWWHPVIYEAMMIAGVDAEQDPSVADTHALTFEEVLADRPQRMLLSRELMPRYAAMSPESANVFDNLHMLHGIVYDLLAYEGWTLREKRAELDRVLEAMAHQPGDAALARRFDVPYPDVDPRAYEPWMADTDGAMTRIMEEMLQEMWPMMSPGGGDVPEAVMAQLRMKLAPGMQDGEVPGSLHDALMAVAPDLRMDPEAMKPGVTPEPMVRHMLDGWERRAATLADVPPWPMDVDPVLPPPPRPAPRLLPVSHPPEAAHPH